MLILQPYHIGTIVLVCLQKYPAPHQWDLLAESSQTGPSTGNSPQHCSEPLDEPVDNFLVNPEPENEHVGVDEEGLYIDIDHSFLDGNPKRNEGIYEEYALGSYYE